MKKVKYYTVAIDPETYNRLKEATQAKGQRITWAVAQAVNEWVNKRK